MTAASRRRRPGRLHEQTFQLTDTLTATVNVGTGNLELDATDIVLPGVDGALSLGRVYNSLSAAPGRQQLVLPRLRLHLAFRSGPRRPPHGERRRQPQLRDPQRQRRRVHPQRLRRLRHPPGLDAVLTANAGGFTLSFDQSGEVDQFGGDGNLLSDTDRNKNTITFNYYQGRLVTAVTSDAGVAPSNSATIAYSGPGGRVSSITQQAVGGGSRTVSYGYETSDSYGNSLVQVTNANGGITTYGTADEADKIRLIHAHCQPRPTAGAGLKPSNTTARP